MQRLETNGRGAARPYSRANYAIYEAETAMDGQEVSIVRRAESAGGLFEQKYRGLYKLTSLREVSDQWSVGEDGVQ